MLIRQPQEVERKVIAILRTLSQSSEPLGARVISHYLQNYGIELSERAVRYHLQLMDALSLEKNEDEKIAIYEERLLSELKNILKLTDMI